MAVVSVAARATLYFAKVGAVVVLGGGFLVAGKMKQAVGNSDSGVSSLISMFSAEKPSNVRPAADESAEEKAERMQRYEEARQRINSRTKAPTSAHAPEKLPVRPASQENSERSESAVQPNVAVVR